MIVKILPAKDSNFGAVRYNSRKQGDGDAELMSVNNMPSHIDIFSKESAIKNFLKSHSKGARANNVQFHATISAEGKSVSKHDLNAIAKDLMKEHGYEKQPYIVVYHSDTKNNHVHIVSSRYDVSKNKNINSSFEGKRIRQDLDRVLNRKSGIKNEKYLDILNYNVDSFKQFINLAKERNVDIKKSGDDEFLAYGPTGLLGKFNVDTLNINKADKKRKLQIRAILHKYKNLYSNEVYGTYQRTKPLPFADNNLKIEYQSQLKDALKEKFGMELVFHNSDNKLPFGYSIIDNKTKTVFKGSQLIKLNDLFDITNKLIDKNIYTDIKRTNAYNNDAFKALVDKTNLDYNSNIDSSMFYFKNKFINKELFWEIKKDTKAKLLNGNKDNSIDLVVNKNKYYLHNKTYNYIAEMNVLVPNYLEEQMKNEKGLENIKAPNEQNKINLIINELLKDSYTPDSQYEDQSKKKKRKKKKRTRRR